jgi:predicted nucleotidyltransferase
VTVAAIMAALAQPPRTPGVIALYLFGSCAEGRVHRESDVDVGVLLDRRTLSTPRDRFETRLQLIGELTPRFGGRSIDLVVLNDAPPGLARRIVTAGRAVYCSEPPVEHAFRRDVQLRAADLEPFIRRTRRVKLEAIGR